MALIVSLASGIYGLIMTVAWLESAHLDLHHNVNLMLFWPTDILGVIFAFKWLISGQAFSLNKTTHNLIILYFLAHLLAALVYVFAALLGFVEQDVVSLLIFVAPALMGFSVLVWNAGFSAVRRIRFS